MNYIKGNIDSSEDLAEAVDFMASALLLDSVKGKSLNTLLKIASENKCSLLLDYNSNIFKISYEAKKQPTGQVYNSKEEDNTGESPKADLPW